MRSSVRAVVAARTCDAVGARGIAADLFTAALERRDDRHLAGLRPVDAVTRSSRPNAERAGDVDDDGALEDNLFASARSQHAQPLAQSQQLGVAPAEFLLTIGLGLARGP